MDGIQDDTETLHTRHDKCAAHENTDSHVAHDNTDSHAASHAAHKFLLVCNAQSLTRMLLTRVQHTTYLLRAAHDTLHEFYLRAAHFVSHASFD